MSSVAPEPVFSVPLNHFRGTSVASLGCAEESAEQRNLPTGLARFIGDHSNQLLQVFNMQHDRVPDAAKPSIWSNGSAWPLVLFGPSGTGKTSLGLTCLTNLNSSAAQSADRQPAYITAVDFDRRFRSAMETDSVVDFRAQLSGRAGLLIDNLHELATKPIAQREIVQLIDAMVAKNRPILFTLTESPHLTHQLIPQLASRLGQGLALPVSPPGTSARIEIIRDLADLHELRFADDAIELLVDRLLITVPAINHFMLQLKLSLQASELWPHSSPIDTDTLIHLLNPDVSFVDQTEKLIRQAVAKAFNIKVADLSSQSRRQTIVMARGVAIYLNRVLAKSSFKKIGQQFGNRDHSTIMHAYRKIENLVASNDSAALCDGDLAIQQTVQKLKQALAQKLTDQLVFSAR